MILKMEKQDSNIDVTETALSLKERGNQCIKEENFKEAALLYTHAIKLEPDNFSLYSNRSLAYLKSKHYYLSLQDANETIRLQPQWAKGYFRRAEVEAAVGLTDEATLSYTRALQLQPQDSNIIEAINRVTLARKRKKEADDKLPWLCCCVGVTIGVTLVILDHVFGKHENPVNPLMQVSFVLTVAGAALGLGKGFNMYVDSNISSPLLVPPDTEDEAVRKLPSVYRWASLAMALVLVLIDCSLEIIDLKTSASRVLFVIVCTLAGWAVGHLVRRSKIQNSNIQTDKSTEEEAPAEENVVPEKITNKYTKAQARYRYKKGKKN